MAEKLGRQTLSQQANIHDSAPDAGRTVVDRTFELPGALFGAVVALFLGFIATMAAAFGNPALAIPLVIFAFVIVAGFGLPVIWTKMEPETNSSSKSWNRFQHEGVMTGSGRASAGDAMVQVLILPVLIFLWGICSVIIAALV